MELPHRRILPPIYRGLTFVRSQIPDPIEILLSHENVEQVWAQETDLSVVPAHVLDWSKCEGS